MTTSTDITPELTVGQLILRGMQRAGYVSSRHSEGAPGFVEDFAMLSDMLEMRIASLSLEGIFARSARFLYQTLTVDTESYAIDQEHQRIFGDAVYIAASESNVLRPSSETLVTPLTRAEYNLQVQKSADSSVVTYYYLDEDARLIYFWPIPSEAGTVRLQVQRRLKDVQTASVTPDLQREWNEYLSLTVSEDTCLTKSFGLDRAQYFGAKARELLPKLKAYANEGATQDAVLVHPTHWS